MQSSEHLLVQEERGFSAGMRRRLLHNKCSSSRNYALYTDNKKITIIIINVPAISWRLIQGAPCPRPETRLGLAPAATPRNPMERDKRLRTMT